MAKGLTRKDWGLAPEPFRKTHLLTLLGHPTDVEPPVEARADLLATIQDQIIPQLVMAHRPESEVPSECADSRGPPTEEEVAQFSRVVTSQDLPSALAFVQTIAAGGVSLEVILLHLIAPTARLLGTEWENDERSFTEVTLGLSMLQQVVHVLGPSFAPGVGHRGFVVLLSPQSEQHTLGIYLLGEFLRRAGWGVQVAPSMSESDLLELVESERVEMVGLSVSNTDLLKPLARLVAAVKKASINPDITVMLGGSPELAHHATKMGATFCADPRDAVRWLELHGRNGDSIRGS
jgi:methanogenic corrinoid protein MtbC1